MILRYIDNNYVLLYELVGLLLMLKISAHVTKRTKLCIIGVVGFLLLLSVVNTVEEWTQYNDGYIILRSMLTACKYSIYPIVLFLLMLVTIEAKTTKKIALFLLIPIFICIPIFFTSQWTKLVFEIKDTNNYGGGAMPYLPYILFAVYAVIFIISNVIFFKNYSRNYRFIMMYVILGSILGVLIVMIFHLTDNYTMLFTTSILLYYLSYYIHMSMIDALTRLLNRHSFYQDIKAYNDRITCVVSVDMNNLKTINDNEGHEAGDTAIYTIANVLMHNSGSKGTCYRTGGDEFIILYLDAKEEEVIEAINNIRNAMNETKYVCAYGYQMKNKNDDIDEIIRLSDEKMYEDKAIIKGKKGR